MERAPEAPLPAQIEFPEKRRESFCKNPCQCCCITQISTAGRVIAAWLIVVDISYIFLNILVLIVLDLVYFHMLANIMFFAAIVTDSLDILANVLVLKYAQAWASILAVVTRILAIGAYVGLPYMFWQYFVVTRAYVGAEDMFWVFVMPGFVAAGFSFILDVWFFWIRFSFIVSLTDGGRQIPTDYSKYFGWTVPGLSPVVVAVGPVPSTA